MDKKREDFIKELEALFRKYRMTIGACGCCNSPWIVEAENDEDIEFSIKHFRDDGD